jgi:hypothetical protein
VAQILAFNPNHGPDGKFTSADGGSGGKRFVVAKKTRLLVGDRLGKLLDKVGKTAVGSELQHVSWKDTKTGNVYDFRPKGGMRIATALPTAIFHKGEITETRKSGRTTTIPGPTYNVLFRNCQDAEKWLGEYVDKFKGNRRSKTVRIETWGDASTESKVAAAELTVALMCCSARSKQ